MTLVPLPPADGMPEEPTPIKLINGFRLKADGSKEATYGEYVRKKDYDALRAYAQHLQADQDKLKRDAEWQQQVRIKQDSDVYALRAELSTARTEREEMRKALDHNLAVSNKSGRHAMAERDQAIRSLRKIYSAIEIASMTGLTRQRVHQILNENDTALVAQKEEGR